MFSYSGETKLLLHLVVVMILAEQTEQNMEHCC